MSLSYDLISQFAKITNDSKKIKKEITTYGTIVKYNNANYVKMDGSDLLTPYSSTVALKDGDRVVVSVKNHTATVTGSTSNPSASNNDLQETNSKVSKFNKIVADKITADQLEVINGYFEQILAISGKYEDLQSVTAKIETLRATYARMENINASDVEAINAEIESIKSKFLESTTITTEDLNAANAQLTNITAYNANFTYVSAEKLKAVKAQIEQLDVSKLSADQADLRYAAISSLNAAVASIEQLQTNKLDVNTASITYATISGLNAANALIQSLQTDKLDVTDAEIMYANIDFSNIGIAAIRELFSDSGIIKDLVVQGGKITGELVGVTIKGDLIEGNTVTADKLVILGEDGAYYKLNIDGLNNISTSQASKFEVVQTKPENWETNYKDYYEIINNKYIHLTDEEVPEWNSNKYYKLTAIHGQGLDGTNIIAQTITADKITVSDLVAFGATIGGFHITDHSIYSGVKNTATNTTRGVFMNDNGEFSIGDSSNYFRYYYDENTRKYKMELAASSFRISTTNKTIEETLDEIREEMTVNLVIESSRGTVFKNNQASTVLSVIIYRGSARITNMTDLRTAMGNNVYLQWKWRREDDDSYGIISSSDSHLSENGFKYTVTPQDIDSHVTFLCELMNN